MGTCYKVFLEARDPQSPDWQCVAEFDLGKAYEFHRQIDDVKIYEVLGPDGTGASPAVREAVEWEPNHVGRVVGDSAIQEVLRKAWKELVDQRGAAAASDNPWRLQWRAIGLVAEAISERGAAARLVLVGS